MRVGQANTLGSLVEVSSVDLVDAVAVVLAD
jgi:hypothetical protein